MSNGISLLSKSNLKFPEAIGVFLMLEKRFANDNRDAVLVSADSVEALRLAFPNYYMDKDYFLEYLGTFATTGQLSLL